MGFITRTNKRKFEFKHFRLTHSLDRPQPGYVETAVHNPSTGQNVTKYILGFDAIEGRVVDVEWYDRKDDSGHRYVGYMLTVDVDGEAINLDFPYGKPAYRVLTRCGINVDWNKPVRFSAWQSSTPGGKPTTAVCFSQGKTPDGKPAVIKWAYTKEHPNGCPSPTEGVKGLNWDNVERWLKQTFDSKVVPAIKAAGADYAKPADELEAAVQFSARQEESEDDGYPYDDAPPIDASDDSVPF